MSQYSSVSRSDVLRLGRNQDFCAASTLLRAAGFTQREIRRRYMVTNAKDLFNYPMAALSRDLLGKLVRLFIQEESIKIDELIGSGLPPDGCSALESLDLVRTYPHAPAFYTATVRLQPVGDLILASDRHIRTDQSGAGESFDTVYDPVSERTCEYLQFMPNKPCRRFLEICTGSGVGALYAASRFSSQTYASDISERCVHFAHFNALLNGIDTIAVSRSDLFSAFNNVEFDYIAVHPPYMPGAPNSILYRDGGEIGDELLLRLIKELPAYLSKDGMLYVHAMVPDRCDLPFEKKLRIALGDNAQQFDIAMMTHVEISPIGMCQVIQRRTRQSEKEALQKLAVLSADGVERFVSSTFLVQRHNSGRVPFTARRSALNSDSLQDLMSQNLASVDAGGYAHQLVAS